MTKKLQVYLEKKGTNIGKLGEAGSLKGGYNQARQILVAKGLIADNMGNILPAIKESYSEGLPPKSFFTSGAGSRRGIADRVLNTAETGYLSRQLVYALQRVEADPVNYNCGTKRAFNLKVTSDIARRLKGRYYLDRVGKPIPLDADKAIGKIIPLKSPLYCLSPKICKTCYGQLLDRNKTPFVGVLAAQIFGERGTQMIMKTFHSGGAVSVNRVDIIKEISDPLTDSDILYVNKIFKQSDNDLYSKVDGKIIIKKSVFLNDKDYKVHSDRIDFEYGYFEIKTSDKLIDVSLDYKCSIPLNSSFKMHQDDELIIIDYTPGKILNVPPSTDSFLDKVKIIKHFLSGKKPWKTADHFTMKLYDNYKELSKSADMVHFEVFASQLLRDKNNPSYPARLNSNYEPIVGSLKRIPSLESWLSALSFEDPNHAITTGLMYDREHRESVLEKIVNGTL
jgi:hypothetical protein